MTLSFCGVNTKPIVAGDAADLCCQKIRAESEVDETGAGDFRRLADVLQLQSTDDELCDVARWTAKLFGKRHGEVGLEIAELRILGRADEIKQRCSFGGQISKGRCETLTEKIQEIHG